MPAGLVTSDVLRGPARPAPAARYHWRRKCSLTVALLFVSASHASAQYPTATCDRVATTRITFGMEGGNMRPVRTTIGADGWVSRQHDTLSAPDTGARVEASIARRIARAAWAGAITSHTLSARTRLATRDAAHPFIALASACGTRRAEYREGTAPRRFRTLFARLDSLAG